MARGPWKASLVDGGCGCGDGSQWNFVVDFFGGCGGGNLWLMDVVEVCSFCGVCVCV